LGGTLLLADTSGQVLDTLSPVGDTVVSARFGSSGQSLYYYLRGRGVLKLDLETRQLDTVLLTYISPSQDFDVWDDSLLLLPGEVCHVLSGRADTLPAVLWQPRFCPSNPSLVSGALMSSPGDFLDELVLVNRTSDSATDLDARPYSDCEITYPNWSPDGKNIVMATAPLIPGGFLDPVPMVGKYNLWVLKR
jgi:Tol biopolymer transport system component